jgi:hypothetical protein
MKLYRCVVIFFIPLFLCFCSLSGGGSGSLINYDEDSLVKGRTVLFQTKEQAGAAYKWSYKATGDADFILVEGATANQVALVFLEPGQYQLKLAIDDVDMGVEDLQIIDAVYDPATYTALTFVKQAGDAYNLSLRFSYEVLNILRNTDNTNSFFDIVLFRDSWVSFKDFSYGCFSDDGFQTYETNTSINLLTGVAAPALPDEIEIEIEAPEISRETARRMNDVDHMISYTLNDDQTIFWVAKYGYPVITENITDFTLYY